MRTFKRTVLQVLPVVAAMMAESCVGGRAAAHAAPVGETLSITVSVKGLDLTTHAGAVAAYTRIRNAARSVCGISDIFLEERAARERCVDEAIGSAVAKLRVPE
ncbi:MAG TPA: UrcA family protein, partial [Steroidobacteraceae bacterium]|nr:UrcA family protein [Steroidobacteraceae bacterium]